MKPVPAPEGFAFEDLPTFDDLKAQHPSLKVTRLRAMLAPVPCWKCTDNTVRYDADGVAEVLGALDDDAELGAMPPLTADALKDAGAPPGFIQFFLMVLNQQTALTRHVLSVLAAREKASNETIRAMGEPLRVGLQLSENNNARLERRNSDLEGNRDKVFTLIETSLSAQAERDIEAKRAEANLDMKRETVAALKSQLPQIVQKWALTSKAGKAVQLLESLNPIMVQTIVDSGLLEPAQLELIKVIYPDVKVPAAAAEVPTTTPANESKADDSGQEPPGDGSTAAN